MELTRVETAYQEIEERIVTLKIAPGSALSEGALVDLLGIGRTPIREALQRLAREGLVTILPRRGIVVSEICTENQLELLTVRRELERLMARLAARRSTESDRDAFKAIALGMREAAKANDAFAFMRLDRELNLLVATACRNVYAKASMELTYVLSRRFWFAHHKQVLDLPLCASLHADLADAIRSRRQREAAAASDRLMDHIEEFTRATLDAPTSKGRNRSRKAA